MYSSRRLSSIGTGLLALVATFAIPASGTAITTLAALGANDLVDFSKYPAGSLAGAQSNNGIGVPFFFALDVSEQGQGWSGNFPANTIIAINQTGGEAEFHFSKPIQGFGVTVDDGYSGSFLVTIDAFEAATPYPLLLDQSDVFDAGGSTVFLGILEATADISVITVSVTGVGGNNDFAVGNLSLVDAPSTAAPEPGTILLTVTGGCLLLALRRRNKISTRCAPVAG